MTNEEATAWAKPQSPEHQAMLAYALSCAKLSRADMAKHYLDWDRQDQVYRGELAVDKEDVSAARQGKPTKMVIPNTFAQVMTFTSFNFLMMTQNPTFYEMQPNGDEDYGTKSKDSEKILEANCRWNENNRILFQELLDISRFGVGVTNTEWTKQEVRANITPPDRIVKYNDVEVPIPGVASWQTFTKYEGNLVRNVSPYRFFPDTRWSLSEFQKGEFCGCEEEYSKGALRDLEKAGEVFGVDAIQPLATGWEKMRGAATRTMMSGVATDNRSVWLRGPSQSEGTVIVTKLQAKIVPNKFKIDGEKTLGPEDFRVLYHIWYANDNRVIKCEPCYYWHDEFSFTVSQFTPDMHRTVNLSLADLIYKLQEVITWLINARVTDVRKNLRGRNVINPSIIDTKSLDGDGDIFLRKGANGAMMDRGILPLAVPNVTQGHMEDADTLGKIMEVVTGVNGNAMGQYSSGRRSAREVAQVSSGSSGRMKMHGQLIWESGPGRRGRLMLSNLRQSLSEDYFYRVIGPPPAPQVDPNTGQPMPPVADRYQQWKGTPEDVIAGQDFFVFDSTLSSEKGFIAQSLQELVGIILSNPEAAHQLDLDPRAMIAEIQQLRGAGSTTRFSLSNSVASGLPPLPPPPQPPPPPTPEQVIAQSVKYADLPPTAQIEVLQAVGLTPGTIEEHQIGKISTTRKAPGITVDASGHVEVTPVEKPQPKPSK